MTTLSGLGTGIERAAMEKYFEKDQEATILIYDQESLIFRSNKKGVGPLMDYMSRYGPSEVPLTIVDRVVGKGSVVLAIMINGTQIKTPIISEMALVYAKKMGVEVESQKIVPFILNRQGDGPCPIERAIESIDDVEEGYEAIQKAIAQLMLMNDKEKL